MADPHNDPTIADIVERLENVEAVLMQLINGDDGPGPDDGPGGDADFGDDVLGNPTSDRRRTGDAAVNLRARLLAADAATRARTTALIRRIQGKADAMYGRKS